MTEQTPLDRLQRIVAADTCKECGRFTPAEPADLAARLGVSATTIRRLANPDYVPAWASLAKMGAALGVPPLALASDLWPHLADCGPGPSLEDDACESCGVLPGAQHRPDCETQRDPWTES